MQYNDILECLQNLINVKPKQREIADIIGVRTSVVGQRASRGSHFSVEEIKKIGDKYGVNLFTKQIQPDWSNPDKLDHAQVIESMIKADIEYNTEENITVDYYPEVFGSCGSGVFVPAEYKERVNIPKKFFSSYSPVRKYSVINAFGDSMMPYIHDKDKLIVEFCEQGEQIRDNQVYVFRFGERIFCKRLVDNLTSIVVKSDNPIYEPIKIDLKEAAENFQIIGRIIGLMRSMQ